MYLPAFIALRYLIAKKSHNVINIISAISAVGMAVGTAALIVILSVYNGFNSLVQSSLSDVDPDLKVSPSKGKVFVPDSPAFDLAYKSDAVLNMCSVLEDNVYLSYDGQGGIARAKGVDSVYEEESPLAGRILDGKFALHKGQVPLAVAGVSLAYNMGINPRFLSPIELYYPARDRNISLSNPASSLDMANVWPSGLFSVNAELDGNLIIVPLEVMRELLDYKDEVSSIEIRFKPGVGDNEKSEFKKELSQALGPEYRVRDRFEQNESLYKMMRYEKSAIFLILVFVIIIIAFNVFGSLSMLVIEKKDDISTLRSMGADEPLIKRIFLLEGWMISLSGMCVGLLLGLCFIWAQSHWGIVMMPSSYMISPYPVVLKWSDLLLTVCGVALIGWLVSYLPLVRKRTAI